MAKSSTRPARRAVPVDVQVGGHWLRATAHAARVDRRRGQQILVHCHSRMIWIPASRVRKPATQHP
jgi:hypothetical protein